MNRLDKFADKIRDKRDEWLIKISNFEGAGGVLQRPLWNKISDYQIVSVIIFIIFAVAPVLHTHLAKDTCSTDVLPYEMQWVW